MDEKTINTKNKEATIKLNKKIKIYKKLNKKVRTVANLYNKMTT